MIEESDHEKYTDEQVHDFINKQNYSAQHNTLISQQTLIRVSIRTNHLQALLFTTTLKKS